MKKLRILAALALLTLSTQSAKAFTQEYLDLVAQSGYEISDYWENFFYWGMRDWLTMHFGGTWPPQIIEQHGAVRN